MVYVAMPSAGSAPLPEESSSTRLDEVSTTPMFPGYEIAAIVPCHNEEVAVETVVRDLLAAVPGMKVYVYDNNSTDATAERARAAGAIVRSEERKGKGNVVRRAFADVDADIYLMIDGDDTYDAARAPEMIRLLLDGPYDHILGIRAAVIDVKDAYRAGHEAGNRLINGITSWVFGSNERDMLSGYRVMSRRFVKSFPALSREFEIETELTVHCLALRVPHASMEIGFKDRPEGSESKLRTYRDGFKIATLIANLARHERPIAFYGLAAAALLMLSVLFSIPPIWEYLSTGLVPRLPSFLAGMILLVLSAVVAVTGLIVDGVRKARHEAARLSYLTLPPVSGTRLQGGQTGPFQPIVGRHESRMSADMPDVADFDVLRSTTPDRPVPTQWTARRHTAEGVTGGSSAARARRADDGSATWR